MQSRRGISVRNCTPAAAAARWLSPPEAPNAAPALERARASPRWAANSAGLVRDRAGLRVRVRVRARIRIRVKVGVRVGVRVGVGPQPKQA